MAVDDSAATDADLAFGEDEGARNITADLLGNDSDPDASDTLSVTAVDTTGTTGLVTLIGGVVSYDPNGAFNALAVGETATDSFTYTISDGNGGTDTATATITINGANDAPTATDDVGATAFETPVTFLIADLLSNDSDPDGDTLQFVNVQTETEGSTTVNGTTSVTFTPDAGFFGEATFTYLINDGNGGSDTATVRIAVAEDTPPAPNPVIGTMNRDRLVGTDEVDRIEGLKGSDYLYGLGDADTFVFGKELVDTVRDRDIIADFEVGLDGIELSTSDYSLIFRPGLAIVLAGPLNDLIYVYGDADEESDLNITVNPDLLL